MPGLEDLPVEVLCTICKLVLNWNPVLEPHPFANLNGICAKLRRIALALSLDVIYIGRTRQAYTFCSLLDTSPECHASNHRVAVICNNFMLNATPSDCVHFFRVQ